MEKKTRGSNLERVLFATLERRRQQSTLRRLTTYPPGSIDFSTNDFLSLAQSPALRKAFLGELNTQPAQSASGSGGSRLLDGNSTYAEQLERDIAAFHGALDGLLCNSGFDANVGIFSCLPQPGDVVIYDEYIHASVHDGMRASRTNHRIAFSHNSVSAFKLAVQKCIDEDSALPTGSRNVFIAVEAIYSMDGDVAPLKEIVAVVDELLPVGNGHIIVDEAHSTGVLGPKGRGLVNALGLESKISIRLHTFGKAMACNGAIILCAPLIRQYLVNYARPLIYTTFLSYPALAAIKSSYAMLMDGRSSELQDKLFVLITLFHDLLLQLQAEEHPGLLLCVPASCPPSPIFSILSSDPRGLATFCQQAGLIVRPIVPPTVPIGAERIRVCLHAGNTTQEIETLVARIKAWVKVTRNAKL
ncbi:hypothetical protein AAFC00_006588 [Neodothiora populina]|uniref:Aminotransferase class I/classII large domain-containing protein n=1 Tax=Neodothiora populina TaxID=2781224 RepID=A0ABR3PAG3_9PEZI